MNGFLLYLYVIAMMDGYQSYNASATKHEFNENSLLGRLNTVRSIQTCYK